MRTFAVFLAAAVLYTGQAVDVPASWTARIPPFKIIGTIYYVGTEDLAAYLITTSAGHILIDTGHERNAETVLAGIRSLRFQPRDVKLILTTQAHFDHVGAHARLKKETGGAVLASAEDKPVMEAGGKGDYHFGPRYYFPPIVVDRVVHDGEVVTLGETALTARITQGHTKGTTTWTMAALDRNGRHRRVVVLGSTAVNEGVKLVDNREYPQIAQDFARSFRVQASLPCEVFLAAHASAFRGLEKAEAARTGAGEDAFIDPAGCRAAIERSRAAFTAELERQQKVRGGKAAVSLHPSGPALPPAQVS